MGEMKLAYLIVFILLVSIFTSSAHENKPNTTEVKAIENKVSNQNEKKPPVKTLESGLCRKCKCDKYKLKLDCSRLKLTEWFKADEIDTLINGNIKFETIDLSFNNLTKIPAFPKLIVKNVLLSFNQIDDIARAAFQNLTHLSKLDLSNNKLTNSMFLPEIFEGNFSPTEYEPLEFLTELNLANNELHKLRENIFEHCDHLEILSLSHNRFNIMDIDTVHAISDLHRLKFLDLSYMQLNKLPDEILHGSDSLETVVLTGNLFKTLPVEALSNSIKLSKLNLDENPIVEIGGSRVFPKLENLEYLSLSYMNELKTIGIGAFSNLPNLKTLQMTHNPVLHTLNVEAFASYDKKNVSLVTYPKLENLYLDYNNLRKLDEKLLGNWETLQQISLDNNPWDCDDHNSWFVSQFVPYVHNSLSVSMTKNIKCGSPNELKDKQVYEIHVQSRERNMSTNSGGSIVLGIFIGIIIGIAMTFVVLLILRKYKNNASSAINYNRAKFDSNFEI